MSDQNYDSNDLIQKVPNQFFLNTLDFKFMKDKTCCDILVEIGFNGGKSFESKHSVTLSSFF
jgi:hypothetical protein